ncbi:MAG: [FeFe] hydrogenase H-cluster radical SAM maturase HydE, partial [Bacteroidota bacterium]|nr:[FeFe] hydrogenase H-cluster radical SAM maturase HydE [Bacteroidota bacterium]
MENILDKPLLGKEDILSLLMCDEREQKKLFARAAEIKEKYVGNIVYFRGLIEYSNICSKNCLYCGVRSGNQHVKRYQMTDDEVFEACDYAFRNGFASLVIQSGERHD